MTTIDDDPRLPVELLLRDLRAPREGLSQREAAALGSAVYFGRWLD